MISADGLSGNDFLAGTVTTLNSLTTLRSVSVGVSGALLFKNAIVVLLGVTLKSLVVKLPEILTELLVTA